MNMLRSSGSDHEQRQDRRHLDDTPLRGDRPKYRRANSELLTGENSCNPERMESPPEEFEEASVCVTLHLFQRKSIQTATDQGYNLYWEKSKTSPRQWFLASTPYQEVVNESPEQRRTQDSPPDADHGKTICRIRPSMPIAREIYPGDRFIPRRHGHSFQAAHHLLKQHSGDWEDDKNEMDYCKQVESLNVTHRREAMRAMMISQECVSGLNQKRVLQTVGERCRGTGDSGAHSGPGTEGKWKCIPRKKPLIRNPEQMLSLSTDQSDEARPIDWSCMDVFVVGNRNGLTIYNSNGIVYDMLRPWDSPTAVKWSNDGVKVACTFQNLMHLMLYDSRKKKFAWSVSCCCSTDNYVTTCNNRCICWSHDDRLIVTACSGTLSVFQSDTGKLLLRKHVHLTDIINLDFSSNFKYLVSTAQDNRVRIYTWPNLSDWYNIEFSTSVKAVAWHPEISGLLCIGGSREASLSLWNINTYEMMDYLPAKFQGHVENLAWNKLSGELVVHWSYAVGNKRHSVIPVLANFERTVDAIPLDKDSRLSFLKFNATYKQLVTYCNDIFTIWNFFGDEKPPGERCLPVYSAAGRRQGIIVRNSIR